MRFLFRMITLSCQDHFSQRKSLSEFLAQKGEIMVYFSSSIFYRIRLTLLFEIGSL